jgi:hypothetical protein
MDFYGGVPLAIFLVMRNRGIRMNVRSFEDAIDKSTFDISAINTQSKRSSGVLPLRPGFHTNGVSSRALRVWYARSPESDSVNMALGHRQEVDGSCRC